MTRHEKQSEAKQSKNKMLDVPVNIGVTLCQQRLNRSPLTEHPKWGKDMNLLTWKSQSTEAELGMNSQYAFLCVCERRRACEASVSPPERRVCRSIIPCVWGWPQLEGWKAEVDGWMHRWAVRDCFKIRCTHSLDLRFTCSLILHVIPLCTSLKGQFTPKNNQKHVFFPLICRAIYPSGLFWCALMSFGDMSLLVSSFKLELFSCYARQPYHCAEGMCIYTWTLG